MVLSATELSAQKMSRDYPPVCESGSFLDRDVKPERLKLLDVPTDSFLGVAPIEVVGPKLLVGHAVAHEIERNLEDLMPHGHDRLLVASVPRDPAISGLQGRAVLAHGPQPGLNQRAAQVPIAFAGFAASALSRTFVLARTHRAPATQVARREEPGHVAAGFSHDADRANPIHPRNGVQRRPPW